MKVVIVGAGLGGLACALACALEGLEVVVLERTKEIKAVGAGIQIPPNASRALKNLGILDDIFKCGTILDANDIRRYENGEVLATRSLGKTCLERYGSPWLVIHRADYHEVLYKAAEKAGAVIRTGASLKHIDFERTSLSLESGEIIHADVVVGADGLWSVSRDQLLTAPSAPTETGDLAYRAVFTREQLDSLDNERISALCSQKNATLWLGPGGHAVFYPLHGGHDFNLVLLRPDDLPTGVRTSPGDLGEMRACFEGWDEILLKLLSCVQEVLKWKLCHHEELETWVKGDVALLGDACHPTLPYQAQGAAMAVEDGAALGKLLVLREAHNASHPDAPVTINAVLKLYESLRKVRTAKNVKGAVSNRYWYHLEDGQVQERRDRELATCDWKGSAEWHFCDSDRQSELLAYDVIEDCEKSFQETFETK